MAPDDDADDDDFSEEELTLEDDMQMLKDVIGRELNVDELTRGAPAAARAGALHTKMRLVEWADAQSTRSDIDVAFWESVDTA